MRRETLHNISASYRHGMNMLACPNYTLLNETRRNRSYRTYLLHSSLKRTSYYRKLTLNSRSTHIYIMVIKRLYSLITIRKWSTPEYFSPSLEYIVDKKNTLYKILGIVNTDGGFIL